MQVDLIITLLGPMLAIADEEALYLLEFIDRSRLQHQINALQSRTNKAVFKGRTDLIDSIENELKQYFKGRLKIFETPIAIIGSSFQQLVWAELQKISMGSTRSYSAIAQTIQKPAAVRAVGHANGANKLAIVVPCHRVIGAKGTLTGYAGGLLRKKWLLEHEKRYGID